MRKLIAVLVIIAMAVVGMAGAANYMYEKASVKGVGYKNVEMIISTQYGYVGQKLVEKESGSGNVITERTELEAERQLNHQGIPIGSTWVPPADRNNDGVIINSSRGIIFASSGDDFADAARQKTIELNQQINDYRQGGVS